MSTDDLAAFQTGPHAYAHLGFLAAVLADAIIGLDGCYLATNADRRADRLSSPDSARPS